MRWPTHHKRARADAAKRHARMAFRASNMRCGTIRANSAALTADIRAGQACSGPNAGRAAASVATAERTTRHAPAKRINGRIDQAVACVAGQIRRSGPAQFQPGLTGAGDDARRFPCLYTACPHASVGGVRIEPAVSLSARVQETISPLLGARRRVTGQADVESRERPAHRRALGLPWSLVRALRIKRRAMSGTSLTVLGRA
jgi:hypothetical protein